MDVSIVIPVHNAQDHLEACLRSVLALRGGSFEVVCVDDGSTDGSLDVLRRMAEEHRALRVLVQGARGVSAARNAGLDAASGDFVLFVDADDLVEPELIEKTLPRARQLDAQMTVFGFTEFYAERGTEHPRELCPDRTLYDGAFSPGDVTGLLTEVTTPNVWRIMWSRAFLERAALRFHEDLPAAEDLAFIWEALLAVERVALVDALLYRYRRDGGSTLTRVDRGLSGVRALAAVRAFGEQRGAFTPAMERQFANLVVDTVQYGLWSASGLPEFEALYAAYQGEWAGFVRAHSDEIASRYDDFLRGTDGAPSYEYLFHLFTLDRENHQAKLAECATLQRELEDARAQADASAADAQAVRESHSFKMGNALMRPAATVKRAFSKQGGR